MFHPRNLLCTVVDNELFKQKVSHVHMAHLLLAPLPFSLSLSSDEDDEEEEEEESLEESDGIPVPLLRSTLSAIAAISGRSLYTSSTDERYHAQYCTYYICMHIKAHHVNTPL